MDNTLSKEEKDYTSKDYDVISALAKELPAIQAEKILGNDNFIKRVSSSDSLISKVMATLDSLKMKKNLSKEDYQTYNKVYNKYIKALESVGKAWKNGKIIVSKDDVEFSNQSKLWAKLSKSEISQFYNKVGEIKLGNHFNKLNNGNYLISIENKMIITNGDYINPSIEGIIEFYDLNTEKSNMEELFYESLNNGRTILKSIQIINRIFEEEVAVFYGSSNSGFGRTLQGQGKENQGTRGDNVIDNGRARSDSKDKSAQFSINLNGENVKGNITETKDLVAVHNLTEKQLKGIIELGGFPMPSIAITKTSLQHELYGEISVVFDKGTIDPSKSVNKVYSMDAYTPTFPRIEYKQSDSALEVLAERLDTTVSNLDSNNIVGSDLERITYYLKKFDKTALAFIKENNLNEEYQQYVKEYRESGDSEYRSGKNAQDNIKNEYKNEYQDYCNELAKSVEGYPTIEKNVDRYYMDGRKKSFWQTHLEYNLENLVNVMKASYSKAGENNYASANALGAILSEEFKSIKSIKEAEYLLKKLSEQDFKTYEDTLYKMYGETIDSFYGTETDDSNYRSELDDTVEYIMQDIARAGLTKKSDILNYLKSEGYDSQYTINDNTASKIEALFAFLKTSNVTQYFEAKPRRAVPLSEIKFAVIPEDSSSELIQDLKQNSIPFETHKTGQPRMNIIKNHQDVLFSLKEKAYTKSSVSNAIDNAVDNMYVESGDVKVNESIKDEAAKMLLKGIKIAQHFIKS